MTRGACILCSSHGTARIAISALRWRPAMSISNLFNREAGDARSDRETHTGRSAGAGRARGGAFGSGAAGVARTDRRRDLDTVGSVWLHRRAVIWGAVPCRLAGAARAVGHERGIRLRVTDLDAVDSRRRAAANTPRAVSAASGRLDRGHRRADVSGIRLPRGRGARRGADVDALAAPE